MNSLRCRPRFPLVPLAVLLFAASNVSFSAEPPRPPAGAVFVMTNHTNVNTDPRSGEPANRVAMYLRGPDGKLTLVGMHATGGQGSGPGMLFAGNGLGSSHSLLLSHDGRHLFAVNAGSDTLSMIQVLPAGLHVIDVVPTGDSSPSQRFPNSVAVHKNLVYVLNAAGDGSITGFRYDPVCRQLEPLPGSTRLLRANQVRYPPDVMTSPAQVAFTPDGRQLVVTIKGGPDPFNPIGPGRVLVIPIDGNTGLPSERFTENQMGEAGPFGFSFDRHGNLLVGFAFTGEVGSFALTSDGVLNPISRAKPAKGDTCWLENNGRYLYASSYGAGIIASFRLGMDGSLELLASEAGVPDPPDPSRSQGPTPVDLGISRDGRFLYCVLPGSGKVAGWRINEDGSLTKVGEFNELGQTVEGDRAEFDFSPGNSPAGIAVL